MTRFSRTLTSSSAVAAPPPESVALESDFVVILAALLCALICVVGLIATARCACRPRIISIASQPSANKGLKKKVLQSLPKFTYTTASQHSQKMKDGDDECGSSSSQVKVTTLSTDCVICLGEFVEGDEIRVLPQCGHSFHVACIDTWLGSHSSCPSCRQILVVERCQKCGQFPAAMPMYGGCGAVGRQG